MQYYSIANTILLGCRNCLIGILARRKTNAIQIDKLCDNKISFYAVIL